MTPNERSLTPMPECCRDCHHNVEYLRADGGAMVKRNECNHPFGVLPHPGCGWFKQRTPSVGGEHA